jgi:hypothetical protein
MSNFVSLAIGAIWIAPSIFLFPSVARFFARLKPRSAKRVIFELLNSTSFQDKDGSVFVMSQTWKAEDFQLSVRRIVRTSSGERIGQIVEANEFVINERFRPNKNMCYYSDSRLNSSWLLNLPLFFISTVPGAIMVADAVTGRRFLFDLVQLVFMI